MKIGTPTFSSSRLSILCLSLLLLSCKQNEYSNINSEDQNVKVDQGVTIEQKVDSLLALMTLDEKIGQMTQVRHFFDLENDDLVTDLFIGSIIHTDGPVPGVTAAQWQQRFIELQKKALKTRLGIPLLIGVDAVHGQNSFNGATVFPHNIGLGATDNTQLVERVAQITAIEAQATGFNWVFSPCIAIPYNDKWGRVYEAFSESTALTSKLAIASVKGHQGDLLDRHTVMATAKHFVGDGATQDGREGGRTVMSQQEISERLLPPYRAAVEAGIGAVMVSFNDLNGVSMHANKMMITDTLKNSMGFDGIVLTDWKGYSRFGRNKIINAGIDMVMAVDGDLSKFHEGLKSGVATDTVSMDRVDDAVKRILRQKFRLGLFEYPFPDTTLAAQVGNEKHRSVARQAVRESLVLLKNDGILPLKTDYKKIVVIGEHADNAGLQSGGWTITWQGKAENYSGATTILDGIKQLAQGEIIYDQDALQQHKDAEVAIIVVGENPYAEFMGDIGDGEGNYKLTLSRKHQQYIDHYKNQGIKTVVVLISGRPLVVTEVIKKSNAFVAAWLPGSEGLGIAEVLFGKENFKGTLPHSWPESIEDYNGQYGPNFWDKSITPLFELGYGLTY
jgi:beta-glucosidase